MFKARIFIALALWTAFGAGASAEAGPTGKELYAQHCARCHADTGHGDGPAYTMQRPWPRDFTTGRYKFRSTPIGTLPTLQDVERTIAKGIPRTSMSGYEKWLSPAEIRLVAQYVLDFSKKSGLRDGSAQAVKGPAALDGKNGSKERLTRGETVFKQNCATCHGADGRGLGELAGQMRDPNGFWVAPADLTDAYGYGGGSKASDIYRTLTTGIDGSPMPQFGASLDDQAREDVAAYVASLQVDPAQRTLVSKDDWNRVLPAKVRGEYMVRAMSCALCHNAYGKSGEYYSEPYLGGGVAITLPGLGVFPTRNITSHPTDGLADWSEEQIARVVTTGYAPDRRIEAFSMPWVFFSHLTDGDARDIAAYVKNLHPVENKVPDRVYYPIWKRIWDRVRQLCGFETGRLEYPPYNSGTRVMRKLKHDEAVTS